MSGAVVVVVVSGVVVILLPNGGRGVAVRLAGSSSVLPMLVRHVYIESILVVDFSIRVWNVHARHGSRIGLLKCWMTLKTTASDFFGCDHGQSAGWLLLQVLGAVFDRSVSWLFVHARYAEWLSQRCEHIVLNHVAVAARFELLIFDGASLFFCVPASTEKRIAIRTLLDRVVAVPVFFSQAIQSTSNCLLLFWISMQEQRKN